MRGLEKQRKVNRRGRCNKRENKKLLLCIFFRMTLMQDIAFTILADNKQTMRLMRFFDSSNKVH